MGELALDLGVLRAVVVFDRLGADGAVDELLLFALELLDFSEQIPDGLIAGEVGAQSPVLRFELAHSFA
jgi:hypothetical protein